MNPTAVVRLGRWLRSRQWWYTSLAVVHSLLPYGLYRRLVPDYMWLPPHSVRTFRRGGLLLTGDVGSFLPWVAYFNIRSEYAAYQEYLRRLRPGMVVVDVGANWGYTALQAAQRVGPAGRVVAFEPHPETARVALQNFRQNPACPVQLFPEALGAVTGKLTLTEPPARDSGMSWLGQGEGQQHTVEVQTLDAWAQHHALERLDGLKIDVEGAELAVLQGAEETLRHHRPWLWLEMDDALLRRQGTSEAELADWLEARGYQLERHGLDVLALPLSEWP